MRHTHTTRLGLHQGLWRFALLVLAFVASSCGGDSEPGSTDPQPTSAEARMTADGVLEAYREAYNAADIDELMSLFDADSIVTNHPAALYQGVGSGNGTLSGLVEIREANELDRGNAAEVGAYEFTNVKITGDTITWDHTWLGANGAEWCGAGHSAVMSDGRFVTWTYADPATNVPCSPDCSPGDAFQEQAPAACNRS